MEAKILKKLITSNVEEFVIDEEIYHELKSSFIMKFIINDDNRNELYLSIDGKTLDIMMSKLITKDAFYEKLKKNSMLTLYPDKIFNKNKIMQTQYLSNKETIDVIKILYKFEIIDKDQTENLISEYLSKKSIEFLEIKELEEISPTGELNFLKAKHIDERDLIFCLQKNLGYDENKLRKNVIYGHIFIHFTEFPHNKLVILNKFFEVILETKDKLYFSQDTTIFFLVNSINIKKYCTKTCQLLQTINFKNEIETHILEENSLLYKQYGYGVAIAFEEKKEGNIKIMIFNMKKNNVSPELIEIKNKELTLTEKFFERLEEKIFNDDNDRYIKHHPLYLIKYNSPCFSHSREKCDYNSIDKINFIENKGIGCCLNYTFDCREKVDDKISLYNYLKLTKLIKESSHGMDELKKNIIEIQNILYENAKQKNKPIV